MTNLKKNIVLRCSMFRLGIIQHLDRVCVDPPHLLYTQFIFCSSKHVLYVVYVYLMS